VPDRMFSDSLFEERRGSNLGSRGNRRRDRAVVVCAVLAMVASACGSKSTTAKAVVGQSLVIADFDPFSGANANYGFTEESGCIPAVNLINATGGMLGNKLKCQIVDNRAIPPMPCRPPTRCSPPRQHLVAIVDSDSGLLTATTPLFNAAHIPELSLGGDVPFDKSTLTYFWRTIPGDDVNGFAVSAYIASKSYKHVGAMFSSDQAAQGNVPRLVLGLKNLKTDLAINQGLAVDRSSYQTEIHKMTAASADVMTMESDAQTAGVLYGQMKQAGALLPIALTAGADNTDFDKAVSAAIGDGDYKKYFVKILQFSASSGPAWEAFDEALMSPGSGVKDASTHEQDSYSQAAYDNVNMIALAMLEAKSTDPKIFNAFIGKITEGAVVVHTFADGSAAIAAGKTVSYQGVEGVIHFDKYHNSAGVWAIFDPITHAIIGRLTADQVRTAQGA
jgi:branched-chain amino acid transport system substrate-binding protein